MPLVFRTVTKRFFIITNIVLVGVFLLACLNVYLPPDKWWFIALLGVIFPFLLVLVTGFFFLWLIFRSRWMLLSLCALLLGYSNIRAVFGFHFGSSGASFVSKKQDGILRVMTWNVLSFDAAVRAIKQGTENRRKMIDFIGEQQADVLCFQEYFEPNKKGYYSNVREISALGYPYYFRATDYSRRDGSFQAGIALFSRYPILDTFHLRYVGPRSLRAAESLIGVDLLMNNKDTIRVYTTHLQSLLFQQQDLRNVEILKNADDSMMEASKSLALKLKFGYSYRAAQAALVREQLDKSPYPEVICGDFNDVPNSYTYFKIKGDRRDAFVEKGNGLGRTFSNISPTLRIDYVMADKQFEILQYKRVVLHYSDHFPLIADLKLNRP